MTARVRALSTSMLLVAAIAPRAAASPLRIVVGSPAITESQLTTLDAAADTPLTADSHQRGDDVTLTADALQDPAGAKARTDTSIPTASGGRKIDIPEPTSMLLVGGGLLRLAAKRRRRHTAAA